MSLRSTSVGAILEPRPGQPLPSITHVMSGNEQDSFSAVSSSPHRSTNESTPTSEPLPEPINTAHPSRKISEVFKKALNTIHDQIRANGFTDEDIKKVQRDANLTNPYEEGEEESEEHSEMDPYQERADEIGISHRIPGIGHIGKLLAPKGWKPGDEPITPSQARELQKESYEVAKSRLAHSIAGLKNLKGSAFKEASDAKNEEWFNETNLIKLICEEQITVYRAYKAHRYRFGQERPKPLLLSRETRSDAPSPSTIRALNSASNRFSSGFPTSRSIHFHPPINGFDKPEPSPKVLSPSILDPSLIPSTVEAVIQKYHTQKIIFAQLQRDNELHLKQCLTKYGPHLGPGHRLVQQALRVSAQTPPQLNHANGGTNGNNHSEGFGLTSVRYAPSPSQNGLGIYDNDEPVELALSAPLKPLDPDTTPWPSMRTPVEVKSESPEVSKRPKSRKNGPTKRTPSTAQKNTKGPVWYASDLARANLPAPHISASALQAGLNYDPKAGFKKRRRGANDPVPVPQCKMPADKIRALFKSGLPVRYIGEGKNPYVGNEEEGPVVVDTDEEDSNDGEEEAKDGTYGARKGKGGAVKKRMR
ncbi:MAG: hypothetical protein Q9220_001883 [cf. Caloplaca sp. 1 TL-2023]